MTVRKEDLRIDVFRAGGSVAVRVTHLPTGVVAECSRRGTARQNFDAAVEELGERLRLARYSEG